MAEITSNSYKEEIENFKESILKNLHDLETKLTSTLSNKVLILNKEYESIKEKMNLFEENNKDLITSLVEQKLKAEKITELESFKNKVDGMLITHSIRIKNSLDDISKIKTKYDKIISDNLYIPGFIGSSCQFKNLSEYLSYNISEFSKVKIEKEQMKKDIKALKVKMDGMMKNIVTLNDNTVKLCNIYTDNKQQEFRNSLESAKKDLNQKSLDMRTMIIQSKNDLEKKEEILRNDFNKLLSMKSELIDMINEKYLNFEKKNVELSEQIMKNYENIEIHQKQLDIKDEEIKNLNKKNKDLSDQINYYRNEINKVIILLRRIKDNPYKNELSKYILSISTSTNNKEGNKNITGSPKKLNNRNIKLDNELTTDESIVNKNENNIKIIKNKTFSPKKKKIFNKLELPKKTIQDLNSESSKGSMIEEDENKIIVENKRNENSNNNIKEAINDSIKENKEKDIKEKVKENLKENIKTNIKERLKKTLELKINTPRDIYKKIEKKNTVNIKISNLPLLLLESNEENTYDGRLKMNFKTENENNEFENNKNIKKDLKLLFDNNNKIKVYKHRNSLKKGDTKLKQDKNICKIVDLSLPLNSITQNAINNSNNSNEIANKTKLNMVNSLINNYRAKLFSRTHSPDENIEILDIPKKVTQAFGRTTYNFYFKKDAIDCSSANKNINNFGYESLISPYNFKKNKKNNTIDKKSS